MRRPSSAVALLRSSSSLHRRHLDVAARRGRAPPVLSRPGPVRRRPAPGRRRRGRRRRCRARAGLGNRVVRRGGPRLRAHRHDPTADGYAVSLTHLGASRRAGAVRLRGRPVGAAGADRGRRWRRPVRAPRHPDLSAEPRWVRRPATLLPPRAVAPPPSATPVPVVPSRPRGPEPRLPARLRPARLRPAPGSPPPPAPAAPAAVASVGLRRLRPLPPAAAAWPRRRPPSRPRRRRRGSGERSSSRCRQPQDRRRVREFPQGGRSVAALSVRARMLRRLGSRPAACDHHRSAAAAATARVPRSCQRCRRLAPSHGTAPARCSSRARPSSSAGARSSRLPTRAARGGSARGTRSSRRCAAREAADARPRAVERSSAPVLVGLGTGSRRVCGPALVPLRPLLLAARSRRRSGGGRVGAGAPPRINRNEPSTSRRRSTTSIRRRISAMPTRRSRRTSWSATGASVATRRSS